MFGFDVIVARISALRNRNIVKCHLDCGADGRLEWQPDYVTGSAFDTALSIRNIARKKARSESNQDATLRISDYDIYV